MIFLYVLVSFCALPTPQRLLRPGIVVLGSKKCNYTQKIVNWLTAQGKPFTIEYIDNDKELNNYIVDEHKGGIPIVFENGVYQGTGKEYVNKQNGGVLQPVVQPSIQPATSQPVELQQATPQPIESQPTTPQPVTPQPVTPQPKTPQPVTPQPATPQPETPQPVTPQPIESQPVAPRPATPQPATPQPANSQPSTQKPVTPQLIVPFVINPVTNPVGCKK